MAGLKARANRLSNTSTPKQINLIAKTEYVDYDPAENPCRPTPRNKTPDWVWYPAEFGQRIPSPEHPTTYLTLPALKRVHRIADSIRSLFLRLSPTD
jgi:hypothetical protein